MLPYRILRATEADAEGIASVFQEIAQERIFSAIDIPFTVEEERVYIRAQHPREAFYVAVANSEIVGIQTLDLWAPHLHSMRHVGQIGTFILAEWRHRGLGKALFQHVRSFARSADYAKLIVQVRDSNEPAHWFYKRLGFQQCGRLRRQVRIDGREDDEILMELFL